MRKVSFQCSREFLNLGGADPLPSGVSTSNNPHDLVVTAYFHQWVMKDQKDLHAVVELLTGKVSLQPYINITFTEPPNQ